MFNKEEKVFIPTEGVPAIVKDVDIVEGRFKLTYFEQATDERKTAWFKAEQIKPYKKNNGNKQYYMVKELHKKFGSPYANSPQMLSGAGENINKEFSDKLEKVSKEMKSISASGVGGQVLARASWMLEELAEFLAAKTLEDQADSLTDLSYFDVGTFVEMGVEPDNLFNIVHAANMGKLWEDGLPRFNEQGKWIKPPTWEAPEPRLKEEINRQQRKAK